MPAVGSRLVILCPGGHRLAHGPAFPARLAPACMLLDKDYSSHIAQHALGLLLVCQW